MKKLVISDHIHIGHLCTFFYDDILLNVLRGNLVKV